MKRISGILLTLILIMNTLPASAVRGYRSLWIECENSYTALSGDFKAATDNNASGRSSLKLDSKNEGVHEAAVNFTLSYDGEYDIFILGSPGNANWASIRKWKLNDGEYQADMSQNLGAGYTTADARAAGLSWQKLTTTVLKKGNNSLSFYVDSKRSMGNDFYYSVLDTIAIVPSDWGWTPNGISVQPYDKNEIKMNYVSGTVPDGILNKKDSFTVNVGFRLGAKTSGMPKLYAELALNGETVSRDSHVPTTPLKSWGIGIPYDETFNLTVPFNIPDGLYEIRAGIEDLAFEDGTECAVVGTVRVGNEIKEDPAPYKAVISNVSIDENIEKDKAVSVSADVSFDKEIDFETRPYLSLWKDGLLYEVLEGNTKITDTDDKISFSAVMSSDMPVGEYDARVGLHYINSENTELKKVTVSGTDAVKSAYHKPMSYGNYYAKRTGREHFWYINQVNAAIFDGEPYIPFGGMFVFTYITGYNANDPAGNEKRFEQDKADLDILRAAGINDLYINPVRDGAAVPVWAWQYLLDYLEETGWNYGLQLNCTNAGNESDLYYPHATEASKQFKVENVTKSGEVNLTASKSFAAGVTDAKEAVYTVVNDESGSAVDSGICSLSVDSDGNLLFSAKVKLPSEGSHTVYFTPKIYGSFGAAINCWENPERYYDKIENFVSKFSLGDNLRFAVDITRNEMGIYNHFEAARIASEEFNKKFAAWLSEKYKDVSALNAAWKSETKISSFEEAAELIPVYTSNKDDENNSFSYYVNMDSGKAYRLDTHNGVSWNDYLDARDDAFLEFNNTCADKVKEHLNIPVIYKHCSIQRRYFINKNTVGGIDGMGSEAYGPSEKIISMIGTTGSHSNQFARTAWNIVTETNTEENVNGKYESGLWSYPSKEEFFSRFIGVLDNGAKGIFDFLLADRHDLGGNLGKAYSWVTNTDTITWGSEFTKMLDTPEMQKKYAYNQYAQDTFYFYPSQKNWWWNPNERGNVQLLDDTTVIKRLKTEEEKHVLQTDSLDVDTRVIFINIQDGPYSQVFGPALSKFLRENHPDKRIVILGHRNDLGSIPEVDKYYTAEKAALNDSETVQILNPTASSEILKTTDDGKAWALKDGNLYIIATDAFVTHEGEFGTLHYVDELGITDVSELKNEDTFAESGFSDMKGHWAESDVNYMKNLKIAEGVGNNRFMPEDKITVAEFTALIARVMNYREPQAKLDNISEDKWYYKSMAQAFENGLLTEDMLNEPQRAIKREEMAFAAANALKLQENDFDLSAYSDADTISDYARDAVKNASKNKIIFGMDDGTFRPSENATRAQAVVIVKRLMDFCEERETK